MWKIFAGSKWMLIAAGVLVVGLISFFTIQYIQQAERDSVTTEIQEKQIQKRNRIDEAIRTAPTTVDSSMQYLIDRQGD